jgi:hypothetical protein
MRLLELRGFNERDKPSGGTKKQITSEKNLLNSILSQGYGKRLMEEADY